ncbi:hypothetical protein BJX96DRAFT_158048 [Aspergillus floccosus]
MLFLHMHIEKILSSTPYAYGTGRCPWFLRLDPTSAMELVISCILLLIPGVALLIGPFCSDTALFLSLLSLSLVELAVFHSPLLIGLCFV